MFKSLQSNKEMSGYDLMKKRLEYTGYDSQDGRNVKGKYDSFSAALKNSYQAEQITLGQGTQNEHRQRCLINPSRLTEQFDKKVISIDFESGVQEGTVFYQDRTKRHQIVDLQQHTEEAYFRGTITRADYEIDIDDVPYWCSVRGPVETATVQNQKHGIAWNDLNYSLVIKITKDSRTIDYFSRHKVTKMKLTYEDAETGELLEEWHNQKVVATDKYSEERIMEVYLDEWYDNEAEDASIPPQEEVPDLMVPHIEGPASVNVYDENLSYSIVGFKQGSFTVSSNKVKINEMTNKSCVISILAGKAFSFILSFVADTGEKVEKIITVKPF